MVFPAVTHSEEICLNILNSINDHVTEMEKVSFCFGGIISDNNRN